MFTRATRGVSLRVREEACTGCGRCAWRCRRQVLGMEYRGERPRATVVDIDRCKGCGKCVKICPAGAIELVVVKNGKP